MDLYYFIERVKSGWLRALEGAMKDAMQDAMHVRFKMAPAKGACHQLCVDFQSVSVPDVRALLSLHEMTPKMVISK